MVPVNKLVLETVIYVSLKLKIRENQNQGNSKPQSQVFMAVCESKNPESPLPGFWGSRIFSSCIFSSWFLKLKIRETQNLGSCYMVIMEKSGKLKSRELKIRESQNPGSSKSGKPKIREPDLLYGHKIVWWRERRKRFFSSCELPHVDLTAAPTVKQGTDLIDLRRPLERVIFGDDGLQRASEVRSDLGFEISDLNYLHTHVHIA